MSAAGNGSGGNVKRTLVEEGAEFRGVLTSRHPVLVMGTVEGDLNGPALEVSDTGVVAGRIRVGELRSRGEVAGDVEAEKIQLGGRVRDKTVLRAKSLQVEQTAAGSPGAIAFGDCELEVGDPVDKAAVIAAAAQARSGVPAAATPPVGATPQATMPVHDTDDGQLPAPVVATGEAAEGSGAVGRRGRKGGAERTA